MAPVALHRENITGRILAAVLSARLSVLDKLLHLNKSGLRTALLLVMGTAAFVAVRPTVAQESNTEAAPLTVAAQYSSAPSSECKAGEEIVVRLHYTGTQPLRGYLVRVGFADAQTGKITAVHFLREARQPGEPMISGEEWTRNVCTVAKNILWEQGKVTADVDVLKFADNSIWGPAELRVSHHLIGMLDGMDFISKETELQRFVSPILPEKGPAPVGDIQTQTIGPLMIETGLWRDEDGQDMFAAEVTNVGDQPVRGYRYLTSFFDPTTGGVIRQASTKELETHGNPSDFLAPGASWVADPRKFSHLADGTLASYKINVDLVVFADGSTFGPINSAESQEVLGMIQGIDDARRINQKIPPNVASKVGER